MMYKYLTILSLAALGLCACKPTPRIAHKNKTQQQQQQQAPTEQQPAVPTPQPTDEPKTTEEPTPTQQPEPTPTPTQQPEPTPTPTQQPEPTPTPTQQPEPTPAQQPESTLATEQQAENALLIINVTRQPYNRLTPWEKQPASQRRLAGTYLGNGLVLTYGKALQNATYIELSLPDGTHSVPARIISCDDDLSLALITVAHEQDATIFDNRLPCNMGEAMQRGQEAELWCTLNGCESLRVPLQAQVGGVGDNMPRLVLQANVAVPELYAFGAPVMKDDKLVGLSAGYDSTGRKLSIINTELLHRFLSRPAGAPTGAPVLGIELATLEDPVFRSYLKLQDGQTGAYISKVTPDSAAGTADLREGDVITAIEGIKIDNLGRCNLPLYGATHLSVACRYLRPLGDTLQLTISRGGESKEVSVPLNTDASDNALLATEKPDTPPRYAVWGGLVFQPLTASYMQALKTQARGSLPVQFLEIDNRSSELRQQGIRELTALTLVIPTPATLGYENVNFCVVEKINGKTPKDFAEFIQLLDEPTENGIVEITVNKPPYNIYMDSTTAAAVNDSLRRSAIPNLRRTE